MLIAKQVTSSGPSASSSGRAQPATLKSARGCNTRPRQGRGGRVGLVRRTSSRGAVVKRKMDRRSRCVNAESQQRWPLGSPRISFLPIGGGLDGSEIEELPWRYPPLSRWDRQGGGWIAGIVASGHEGIWQKVGRAVSLSLSSGGGGFQWTPPPPATLHSLLGGTGVGGGRG